MGPWINISDGSFWRWWPCFVGSFCGLLLRDFLHRWLPLHYSMGLAMFFQWLVALLGLQPNLSTLKLEYSSMDRSKRRGGRNRRPFSFSSALEVRRLFLPLNRPRTKSCR